MRTPDSPENYNAFKDSQRRQNEKRQQFRVVTRLAGDDSSPISDEQLANDVAKQTGSAPAPEDIVRANRELFREARDSAWAEKIGKEAPITLAMLSDPNGKPISKGDAEAFASIEQTLSNVGRVPSALSGGLPLRGVQLASALVSASGSRGNRALPPLPLPDPRKAPPTPLPDPRDSVPIPLPNPARSAPVLPPSQGQDGTTAPVSGAPTAAPVEKGAEAAHSVEGAGAQPSVSADAVGAPGTTSSKGAADAPSVEGGDQPSVLTGAVVQEGVVGNTVGTPGANSSQSVPMSAPVKAESQSSAATALLEQVNPTANTNDASGTTPVQTAPAAGEVAEGEGQGSVSGAIAGQNSDLGAIVGPTVASDKATRATLLADKMGEASSPNTSTTDEAFIDAVANGDRDSFDKVSKEIDRRAGIPREVFHVILNGVVFGGLTPDDARKILLASLGKIRPSWTPDSGAYELSPPDLYKGSVFEGSKPTVTTPVTPIAGWLTVPADTDRLSDRLIPYFNSLGRWFWSQKQNSEIAKAENAARIGRDQKLSLGEIADEQWAGAPGGSKDAAWGALVGDGRDAFVRWMESRQRNVALFHNLDPSVTQSGMPPSHDFGRPGTPPDPAAVYVGLVLSNQFDIASRWLKARGSTLLGWNQTEEAKKHLQLVNEIQWHIDALPMSDAATRFDKVITEAGNDPTISGQLAKLRAAAANDPGGLFAYVTEKGTESLPDLVMAAIATAATQNPAAGIALSAGLSYRQERSSAALAVVKEKGFDLSKQADIDRLLADTAVWKEMEQRGYTRALLVTLADIASGSITETKFFKNAFFNELAHYTAAPGASMMGETLAQVYSGQKLNAATIAMNGAIAVFKTAASKMLDTGFEKLPDVLNKARTGAEKFDSLLHLSAKSQKMLDQGRDPESVRAFFSAQLKPQKAELIFIRANDLDHLIATKSLDVRALFDPLKGFDKKKFVDALAAGGDVYIPTATYLVYVAPKMGHEISPYVHVGDPGSWNGGESQALYQALREGHQPNGLSTSDKVAAESSPGGDTVPNTIDSPTAPPSGAGEGTQEAARKVPDTTPSDPSGTTSEGYNEPVGGARAVGSEAKAVPNQPQTLPVYGREFLDSVSPGALIGPDTRGTLPEILPEHPSPNPDTAQKVYGSVESRSSKGHADRPLTEPTPGSDRGAAPH